MHCLAGVGKCIDLEDTVVEVAAGLAKQCHHGLHAAAAYVETPILSGLHSVCADRGRGG